MKVWCLGLAGLGLVSGFWGSRRHPENPPITLLISGHFNGSLEPCGCTSPMIGGIRRLATRLAQDRQRGPTVFVLTPNSVPPSSEASPIQLRQNPLKAEAVAEFAALTGCDALGLGQQEATYGPSLLSEMAQLNPKAALNSSQNKPNGLNVHRFLSTNGMLIACASPLSSSDPPPATLDRQIGVELCQQAIATQQIPVLMTTSGKEAAESLAKSVPDLRLIIYESLGTATSRPEMIGNTWLVSPGDLGREAVEIEVTGGTLLTLKSIPLGPDFANASVGTDVMTDYLHRVNQADLLKLWPRSRTGKYSGSQACISCHKDASTVWHDSAHSRAYHDLAIQGHGLDPDCVSCHVTGLSSTNGFRSVQTTPSLARVTCESCHGPGAAHVANPRWVHLSISQTVCLGCHTLENSPNFNFESYWLKIRH